MKLDVVLVDTAGRMQDNEPLMRALAKVTIKSLSTLPLDLFTDIGRLPFQPWPINSINPLNALN